MKDRAEILWRLRVGDLRRIFRHRYGPVLPDDDAGRADLVLILFAISRSRDAPEEKMGHEIEISAPWETAKQAEDLIGLIMKEPRHVRWLSRQKVGEELRLTNAERERLRTWQALPIDFSREDLAEHRKAKKRARDTARRRKAGATSRQAYLASVKSKKPWEGLGISRRTWFRRRVAPGQRRTILTISAANPVPANEASGAADGPSWGNSVTAEGRAMTEGHADTPPSPLSSSIEREPSATSSPASIVIGAARLDNVSTFPKSVAAVHVPDYPPLPSFLDRRKPSGREADAA